MIVTCENCRTNFNLDERLLKSTGSKVRCSKCKHIFIAYPPKPSEEEMLEESVDLEPVVGEDSDTGIAGDSDVSDEQTMDETSSETDEPEDMDLSDIEKMLEVEEDAEAGMEAEDDSILGGSDDDAGEDSLDLSDFEKILDEEETGDDLTEDKADEDEDLVFDLDEALEMEAGEEQISPTSELDLGDLEKMFESEEEETDFSLEDEPDLSAEPEAGNAVQSLLSFDEEDDAEDLKIEDEDLDIEMEGEAPAPETEEREETLNFDMEDIEEDETSPSPQEEIQELEFDLEGLEDDSTEASDDDEPQTEAADVEDLDSDGDMVLKLEMEEETGSDVRELDAPELSVEDEASEVVDLDGVLGTVEMAEDLLEPITDAEEEEIDEEAESREEPFGSLDDDAIDEASSDLDEEAEIDFPDDAVPDIPDEEESFMDEDGSTQEDFDGDEDVSEEISISHRAEEKSWLKKLILWLVVVVVVIVLALGALVFLQIKGKVNVPFLDQIELPFLGKLKAPAAPDSGNLKINIVSDPDARFLDGGKAGKLFLVTGKVKNGYDHPRSYIQVSGSLYTKGAILAQAVKTYCGNVLPDLELQKMNVSEIRAMMDNRAGESNSNVNVKPGGELPFMIVFSDFPESLEEYTVSVVGSSAVVK